MSGATTAIPRNPWMIGLTVMWALLLLMSLLLLVAGASAQGLPDGSDAASIAAGCVLGALAVVVIGVQLGVGAVRWYLDSITDRGPDDSVRTSHSAQPSDESSRFVPPAQSDRPRPARQDF